MATDNNTSNSIENSATANTKNAEQDGIDSVASASNIMIELWLRTADDLTPKELEWFAGCGETIMCQTLNLSEVIANLGCMISSDGESKHGSGNFQDGSEVSTLLFTLSNQLDTIGGMTGIAAYASHRLTNPDPYLQMKKARLQAESEAHHA